jgi:general secretion pathway protein M
MEKSRCHCLLSAGLLLLMLSVTGAAILLPWWSQMQIYDARMLELMERLERFRALSAKRPLLESQLQQVRQQREKNEYYIDAATPAVAAATLQRKVKQVVESSKGELVSTQNLPQRPDEESEQIAIRVRMSSDVEGLAKTLHKLEGGRPLLFVDNLSIRSRKRIRGRRKNRTVEYRLDIRFDLAGYLREGAG